MPPEDNPYDDYEGQISRAFAKKDKEIEAAHAEIKMLQLDCTILRDDNRELVKECDALRTECARLERELFEIKEWCRAE
jgi:FtsZ-binding cell division protein ZapB